MTVATDVMKLAKAAMLELLLESRWYKTAPDFSTGGLVVEEGAE